MEPAARLDRRFSPGWLLISALGVLLFYFLQGEYWRLILHALGEDIPARPGRAVWGKSLLARYVPTNALMIVGRVVMAERYGVTKRVSASRASSTSSCSASARR